ncbi:hypothetical protein QQF54_21165 [Lelliottia sp. V106_10]|uniref:hypothetical protein n=1 Tax=Lelliottia wanjuensis TaxID=3050585 RepID=UPI00254B3304|nr:MULTISPECIES: hypothetical protein [unclassified Lelliottia]MDK9375854.1 hypothetical protein [Lelliottia sp. V106_10]MDK9602404.1 hypothetical protein [Lelliottia sp. V106_5]
MDETDWSQWFTIVDGEPVYKEGLNGSNEALAVEMYYEYLRRSELPKAQNEN